MKKRIIVAAFILLLVGVGVLVYVGQQKNKKTDLYYSGTIEAVTSQLAFQIGGKVATVPAKEGQWVEKGRVLAELDSDEYRSRLEQADANLERSSRNVAQLRANLRVLQKTLPADVAKAEAGVTAARVSLEDAAKNRDRYRQLFERSVVSEKEWEGMRLKYDTAAAKMQDAEATLRQARSNLAKLDSIQKEIEAAQAQVKYSRAAVNQAQLHLRYSKLKAPFAGVVTSKNIEPGEVVTTGREVFSLSDLSQVDLKIFVDETRIGKVRPGAPADVRIDTFPDRVFRGTVAFVSPEGEFTPKIIQTHKERVKLVYLVKISIPNPDFALKTGMPADAWLR